MRKADLATLAKLVGGTVKGDPSVVISSIGSLDKAKPGDLSFLSSRKFKSHLKDTRALAVIIDAATADECPTHAIICDTPYLAYAKIATYLTTKDIPNKGIHPSSVISDSAKIDESAWIGPLAYVGDNVRVGANTMVGPGCVLLEGVELGNDTRLLANVSVCEGVIVGDRVIIHPGAVVGSDGFGMANDKGRWVKIPQIGIVEVGNDAEIGANCTVDRGAVENTVLEEDVRLDNMVHIAHNVRVGAHTALAGQVGVAGSTTIGQRCTVGGNSGITGHITIADDVHITGMAMVTKSIGAAGIYSSGMPAEPNSVWRKSVARFRRIDKLEQRLQELEEKLKKITE